jgi:S1-C subfamily serine protease
MRVGLPRASRILAFQVLLLLAGIPGLSPAIAAMTVPEAILRAKPATVVIISQIRADITMNCGKGPVSVSPTPFVGTGSGWFVDGRGYVVTSAHVVFPPSMPFELRKTAIQEGCVDPALRAQGLTRGQRPDVEERIRGLVTDRAMATMTVTRSSSLMVLLSNGTKLPAEVKKLSPTLALDAKGAPLPDAGRDLALLRVKDGVYPALGISTRDGQIGDAVHILGFPALILTHELLDRSISLEASVTNGAISGFRKDAIGQDVTQTDAPATYGNSGGPAIGNDAALVGVMTFVSLSPSTGTAVQGFNFLVPGKDVLKFLEGTDVRIGESRFNPPWADALGAFFKGDYRGAAAKLTKVNTIVPDLPDVKRVLVEAQEKVKHAPAASFPGSWIALGVTLVSMGVYGGLVGRRRWKNPFRILPTQVIGLEEGLNLDADSPRQVIVTYWTSPEARTSSAVARMLRRKGFHHVRMLKERRRFGPHEVMFKEGEAYIIHASEEESRQRFDGTDKVSTPSMRAGRSARSRSSASRPVRHRLLPSTLG